MAKVLLVDDARLMVELHGTALGRDCFDLIALQTGDDVATRARIEQPDVILLRDGESFPDPLEACRALAADPGTRRIPLVYIGLGLHRERYLEAGVDLFLPRPVTRHELQEAMRKILAITDRHALRRRVDLPLVVRIGGEDREGRCIDLSLTGALLELHPRPEVGDRGELSIDAFGRGLDLTFEVVRIGEGREGRQGAGVAFRGMDAATAARLSRFVRSEGERRQETSRGPSWSVQR